MTILRLLLLCYVTWTMYLAVMALKRARDAGSLTRTATILGYPMLFIGYLFDFAVNVLVCTPLLLELPRETTVTARLKRHKAAGGWRGRVAAWVGDHLLDPFDPSGRHI